MGGMHPKRLGTTDLECILWYNKLLLSHSITKMYNFIDIVKIC